MTQFPTNTSDFERFLVKEYFKYKTVDEVFRRYKYSLPVSVATYHRVLDKFGVVKTAGPNNLLNEAVDFLSHMLHDNLAVEEVYRKLPLRFQTSLSSLYRIAEYVKEGLTRRVGVGLVITNSNFKHILLAEDVSLPRLEFGKHFGNLTIPMGFAKKRDSRSTNITRILQHEVFTDSVVNKSFPRDLLDRKLDPFMYLDIADVRVAIFHLQLPENLSTLESFSSNKLRNYRFVDIADVSCLKNTRAGVKEIVSGYQKYLSLLSRNLVMNPIQAQSFLNRELATVIIDL